MRRTGGEGGQKGRRQGDRNGERERERVKQSVKGKEERKGFGLVVNGYNWATEAGAK